MTVGCIFEVRLAEQKLDESVLRQIDKEIPYHIVFLLEYDGKYQAWTAYKEKAGSGNNAFRVDTYYHTDWLPEEELALKLDGLNMDAVYENFVRQIAGDLLRIATTGNKNALKNLSSATRKSSSYRSKLLYCKSKFAKRSSSIARWSSILN